MSQMASFASPNAVEFVRWDQAAQLERYLDSLATQAYDWRRAKWHRDYSSARAYSQSVAENRKRWRGMLGIWPTAEERVPLAPERHVVAERADHIVYAVTFGTLPGNPLVCSSAGAQTHRGREAGCDLPAWHGRHTAFHRGSGGRG